MKHIAWDVFFDVLKQINAAQEPDEEKAKIILEQAKKHNAEADLEYFVEGNKAKRES